MIRMFGAGLEELRAGADRLDLPADGASLVELLSVIDTLTAKATLAVAAYDRDQQWKPDGASSMAHWLRKFADFTTPDSYTMAATARKLGQLPATATAWVEGKLSGGQVSAICSHVTNRTIELFAEQEADTIPVLIPLPVNETVIAMRVWQARADALLEDTDRPPRPNELFHSQTLAGRYETSGSFDTYLGSIIDQAIRRVMTTDGPAADDRPWAERRADALGDICKWFLDYDHDHNRGRNRPHLNIVINHDDLQDVKLPGQLIGAGPVPPAEVHAILCDCSLHRLIAAGRSTVLDYGTAVSTIPDALFHALAVRDQGCRFPGCNRPVWMTDAHHIVHVEHGGPTTITNTALHCRRDHTEIHKPGWHLHMQPDGTIHYTDPNGNTWTTHPPGPG